MQMMFVITMLTLTCTSPDGMWIKATVDGNEVSLRNEYGEMPVHQKEIAVDESGAMVAIDTSALWERFSIHKSAGQWTGEYWYDNSHSELSCKETK